MGADYFRQSRSYFYSFIFVLPLVVLYDLLVILTRPRYISRAGSWLDYLLSMVGINSLITKLVLVLVMVLAFGLYASRQRRGNIQMRFFPIMLMESFVYALFFSRAVFFLRGLMLNNVLISENGLVLSVGAGLYEELFFRLLPILALRAYINKRRLQPVVPTCVLVLVVSVVFSLFHYIGPERFAMDSFVYRFISSLLLFAIFLGRGFGIAVYTHVVYDLLVFYGRIS